MVLTDSTAYFCRTLLLQLLQVNVGESFGALGAVLWATLDQCALHNDIHNAKIIMMLSQAIILLNFLLTLRFTYNVNVKKRSPFINDECAYATASLLL